LNDCNPKAYVPEIHAAAAIGDAICGQQRIAGSSWI
jgi:hypothetical protein